MRGVRLLKLVSVSRDEPISVEEGGLFHIIQQFQCISLIDSCCIQITFTNFSEQLYNTVYAGMSSTKKWMQEH